MVKARQVGCERERLDALLRSQSISAGTFAFMLLLYVLLLSRKRL